MRKFNTRSEIKRLAAQAPHVVADELYEAKVRLEKLEKVLAVAKEYQAYHQWQKEVYIFQKNFGEPSPIHGRDMFLEFDLRDKLNKALEGL